MIYWCNKKGRFLLHIHNSPNQPTLFSQDYHILKDWMQVVLFKLSQFFSEHCFRTISPVEKEDRELNPPSTPALPKSTEVLNYWPFYLTWTSNKFRNKMIRNNFWFFFTLLLNSALLQKIYSLSPVTSRGISSIRRKQVKSTVFKIMLLAKQQQVEYLPQRTSSKKWKFR